MTIDGVVSRVKYLAPTLGTAYLLTFRLTALLCLIIPIPAKGVRARLTRLQRLESQTECGRVVPCTTRSMKGFHMQKLSIRCLLLTVSALAVLAAAATPANATFTPVNARISATSTDSSLSSNGGAVAVRCPTAEFTGTINGTGTAASGTLGFSSNPRNRVDCTAVGQRATVDCRGLVTLRSTSSVAGTSASGTFALDTGFDCSITVPALVCTLHIVGPQTPTGTWTYTQGTRSLVVDARTIIIRADRPSVTCRDATDGAFRGNYSVASAPRPLTIS